MKIIFIGYIAFMMAGSFLTSCHYNPIVVHPCDTCKTDTSHHPCDTCKAMDTTKHNPCPGCDPDSLAHAFTWKQLSIPGETSLTGCWVFGPNDIYIVGNTLWRYDGIKFNAITNMGGSLNGFNIFAFTKTDYWLVYGGLVFHNFQRLTPGGFLNSCWGTSSSDMFFVGEGGLIYYYDGTTFTKMTSNTTEDLQSVWGTSSTDVWASGFNYSTGGTVIEHYDGNSWSVDNLTNSNAKRNGFEVVWTCDSSNHKFVATSGAFVYRKTDNGNWRNDSTTVPNSLGGGTYVGLYLLRGNSPSDMMASGGWGWIGHWNGKTWKKYDALYDYNNGDYISDALSMNGLSSSGRIS